MTLENELGFNPAQRLLELLGELDIGSRDLVNAWIDLLLTEEERKVPYRTQSVLLRRVGLIAELMTETEVTLRQVGANEKLYIERWRSHAHVFVDTSRWHDLPADQAKQLSDEHLPKALEGLEYAAHELSRFPGEERRLSKEELERILSVVGKAVQKLKVSNLPEHAKTILGRRLKEVYNAVLEYRITGAKGVAKAFDSALSQVLLQRTAHPSLEEGELGIAIREALVTVWEALKNGLVAYKLGEAALKLLGAGLSS